ncbi:hypothetical protein JYK02_05385 [Corallococcus macrosporus]|uniref:Uncharacterized protein n=1 Tax=Corallococcus macrosporus TaxID=35 RepID=A0ABS3D5I9_9BACT|nr:hypothetical protein [Corallococcus macrosporus]MBN8226941.1 hypothetical protein [Corallococcus macrosporus]
MKNAFIILSGGPSTYDPKDPELHDQSWDNFVTAPLLRSNGGTLHDPKTEDVHWLIFEPAYKDRWTSDLASQTSAPTQYGHTLKIKNRHKLNYLDHLRSGAKDRGWKYVGLSTAQGFWDYINKLKGTKVSRVWFYGHARDDLWLSLNHRASDHVAVSPDSDAILSCEDIKKIAAFSFVPQKAATHPHKFFGCNTKAFAEKWANALSVFAEGASEKVDFRKIHANGGMVTLSAGALWYQHVKASAPRLLHSKTGEQVD